MIASKRQLLGALGIVCLVLPAPVQGQERRPLSIDDLFALQRVGAPEISPDGDWIAYTISVTDEEAERTRSRLWMVSADGGDAIPMTSAEGSVSQVRWSPDGRYLSFVAARGGGKSQVWTLNRLGGEAVQLTDIPQGVSDYEWSPDASRLVLVLADGEEEESDDPEPWVITRLQFKRDNVGYLVDDRHRHLFVFDVATKETRQLTVGEYDVAEPAWSPDGRQVAFVANRTAEPDANDNRDIWIVWADSGIVQQPRQVTTNPGADYSPAWSPDGTRLVYVTVTEPDLIWYAGRHLAEVSAAGGTARRLAPTLDRNVTSPRYADDGTTILFGLEDSAERHLARYDRASGRVTRVIDGGRRVGAFRTGPDGLIATTITEPHLPAEVYVLRDQRLRRVSFANDPWLAGVRLGAVENVQFSSADGTEIEGFIVTPPDYRRGQRYPTLLRIHGGPVSQYDHGFNFEAQLFAAHGYAVVMANPRGSSGYGQDFSRAIWADWGNKDFQDVMAGVDYAIDRGIADPDRLGVGGWSYGGILTNYVITQTDRFRGAITGASEVLYRSNYGHDHYQRQWEAELGLPWRNADAWERISPFNRVERIVTPTLIMGGEKDWNVPILNSEQLYQALRRLGRATQLVVYPGEHHGIRRPAFQRDRYERYLAWYDRYVRDRDTATSPEGPR